MFLVRTDLTVSAQSDNHNKGKSYIQMGDSVGFLSEKKLNSGQQNLPQQVCENLLVPLRSIFKSTRLTSRYDFHKAPYIN